MILGIALAAASGIGYGIFQSVNRRTLQDMNVFMSTYVNLLIGTLVLVVISLFTEELSLLWTAPFQGTWNFILAGVFHFFLGWTFLNGSQKGLGAARTAALVSTTPIFGTAIAVITLGEIPNWYTVFGIVLVIAGAYLVIMRDAGNFFKAESGAKYPVWVAILFGLGASLCWSISPIYVRLGLEDLPAPLLGLAIGMVVSTGLYTLFFIGRAVTKADISVGGRSSQLWKLVAGLLVGLATWFRWESLDLTAIALILALSLLSIPTVNLIAPLLSGRNLEQVDTRVWFGSSLIIGGALLAIILG